MDWLQDRYSATEAGRARWAALLAWTRARAEQRTREAQAAVRLHGVQLARTETDGCFGDEPCQWVIRADRVAAGISTWREFAAAWGEARSAAAAYLLATDQAVRQMRQAITPASSGAEIRIRLAHDQVLRAGLADETLNLSPPARRLFQLIVGLHVSRVDRDNTAWLHRLIETTGWPQETGSPDSVARSAWVLVLHARDDPAFRLQVLDNLQALARAGRMSRVDLATRYDHILWETTGVQRYATMGDCVDGRFVVEGIEDERRVAELRRQVGLPTLEEQARMMDLACRR